MKYLVASRFQVLLLMEDFKHPDIRWKSNTAKQTQSRKFLQRVEDNFLTLVIEEPMRGVLLNLLLREKERLLDICWENNTVSWNQSRRLLESIEDKLLVQASDRPTRGEVLPDLVLTKKIMTNMAEQGPGGQAEGREGNIQAVQAGMAGLERIQGCWCDQGKPTRR